MTRQSFVPEDLSQHVTPATFFFNRRQFMQSAVAGMLATGPVACMAGDLDEDAGVSNEGPIVIPVAYPEGFSFDRNEKIAIPASVKKDLTPRTTAGTHNNFYEFLPGRGGPVWKHVGEFKVEPWLLTVDGLCEKPMTLNLGELHAITHEERLYHFRCVERWAMNVPWLGFPLRTLLDRVEPKSEAKYVRFVTVTDRENMSGLRQSTYPWPYHEALRLDEAMHDLTFLATGVYGEPLPVQHGAPVRLVVPWKYGYKSPKSIVRIELTSDQPKTFWSAGSYAHEYGFLSNVNPNIPHPRWSQSESYWLDSRQRFETPIFNGYDERVRSMYPDEPRTPQKPLGRGQVAR